jgi:hypothetical protein
MSSLNLYCTRTKYICAAYQSAFFVDRDAGNKMFAFKLDEDSMPIIEDLVKKTDVLLIAPMSKKRKEKSWEIVPMISVFPPVLEKDSLDNIAADSTMDQEEPEEKDEDEDSPADTTKKPDPAPTTPETP